MPRLPDLADPRYLDEIGWFLYHEEHRRDVFGGPYDEERIAYSRLFLNEVLGISGENVQWLHDKTVVSIGSGCTADLAAWPAAVKIAVDPLLYAYQRLGMLVGDVEGTARTVYLPVAAEDLPLLDGSADLVLCRNALDHMPEPARALTEIQRILRQGGLFFLSVDLGGEPTPDEPTVFSLASLTELLADFQILAERLGAAPHSEQRAEGVRILARRMAGAPCRLDKGEVLRAYMARVAKLKGWSG